MDLFSPDTAPFAVALCLTVALTVVEAIGWLVGFGLWETLDSALPKAPPPPVGSPARLTALEHGPLGDTLNWLSFGKVPTLTLLIVFCTVFSLFGLLEQSFFQRTLGYEIDPFIAGFPAALAGLFAMRWGGRLLCAVMAKTRGDSMEATECVGRVATVVGGQARAGRPAEARLEDADGTTHYLLVEPEQAGQVFGQGSEVLIVRQHGAVFRATPQLNSA